MRGWMVLGLVAAGTGWGQDAGVALPSAVVGPALAVVHQTGAGLRVDKWKGGTVREVALANLESLRKDLDVTLPPLLAAADAAPGQVSAVLPAYRNLEALYDVFLRVVEAARVAGTGEQVGQLEAALKQLDSGRRALGDLIQADAVAEEKTVADLQGQLVAARAAVTPVVAATAKVPAKAKKKVVKKAAAPAQ